MQPRAVLAVCRQLQMRYTCLNRLHESGGAEDLQATREPADLGKEVRVPNSDGPGAEVAWPADDVVQQLHQRFNRLY